jgi:hypothetical protein
MDYCMPRVDIPMMHVGTLSTQRESLRRTLARSGAPAIMIDAVVDALGDLGISRVLGSTSTSGSSISAGLGGSGGSKPLAWACALGPITAGLRRAPGRRAGRARLLRSGAGAKCRKIVPRSSPEPPKASRRGAATVLGVAGAHSPLGPQPFLERPGSLVLRFVER